jgi:hypothetical protein
MAQLESIGAFAPTEPTHGSDSVALETSARRDGGHWVINGVKNMADIEVIHTYEGIETIQTLIVGRDVTGVGAFA